MNQLSFGGYVCRSCEHPESDHSNGFLCQRPDCRCPGFLPGRRLALEAVR